MSEQRCDDCAYPDDCLCLKRGFADEDLPSCKARLVAQVMRSMGMKPTAEIFGGRTPPSDQ